MPRPALPRREPRGTPFQILPPMMREPSAPPLEPYSLVAPRQGRSSAEACTCDPPREPSRAERQRLSARNRTLSVPILLSETDETAFFLPLKCRHYSLADITVDVSKMMNKLKFYQYKNSEDGEAASPASLPQHYVGFAGFSSNRNYQYRNQHSPWVRREMSDMGDLNSPIMRRSAHPTQRETDDSDEMYISRSGLPDIPYPIPEPPRTDQNLRFKREMYGSASQVSLRAEPTTKSCMSAMCCYCCKPDSPPSVVHQGSSFGPHTPHTMPRRGRREVFVRPGLVTRNSRQPGYRSRSCDCL